MRKRSGDSVAVDGFIVRRVPCVCVCVCVFDVHHKDATPGKEFVFDSWCFDDANLDALNASPRS